MEKELSFQQMVLGTTGNPEELSWMPPSYYTQKLTQMEELKLCDS